MILVDGGRTKLIGTDMQAMLRCIRCGACMNHCPVYQSIGGHAYGWVYPGPMGSVLTPTYVGLENALDLPHASTFCNQCGVVCPVKIPLPDLLRKLREQQFARGLRPRSERVGLALWGWAARRPAVYALLMRVAARVLARLGGTDRTHHESAGCARLDRTARLACTGGPDIPGALCAACGTSRFVNTTRERKIHEQTDRPECRDRRDVGERPQTAGDEHALGRGDQPRDGRGGEARSVLQ